MSGGVEYVIVDGVAYPKAGTFSSGLGSGQMCGQESAQNGRSGNVSAQMSGGAVAYDPHQVHRDFPVRWQHYIRANFRNLRHVQQVFGVCERTARKWWKGETGANGGHVAIAVNEHPVAAPRMLFAAE